MTGPKMKAKEKLMILLARRDHSEKELWQKLKKFYSEKEIHEALEYAKNYRWIPSNDEEKQSLSLKFAEGMHRKRKGIYYINSQLQKKGLPEIAIDQEREYSKARELILIKFGSKFSPKNHQKIMRFFLARGFDSYTIHKLIKEFSNEE